MHNSSVHLHRLDADTRTSLHQTAQELLDQPESNEQTNCDGEEAQAQRQLTFYTHTFDPSTYTMSCT